MKFVKKLLVEDGIQQSAFSWEGPLPLMGGKFKLSRLNAEC